MNVFILLIALTLQLDWKVESLQSPPSVIIVGAGPAGIAAGAKLYENGYTNTVILEAENRIGGRINSVFFGSAYIDLGAQWCHGEKDNVVYDMVKDMGILKHTKKEGVVFHSSKKNIPQGFDNDIFELLDTVSDLEGFDQEGKSLGENILERYNATISEKFQNNPEKLELAKESLDFLRHCVLSSEGALSWFDPSGKSDFIESEGDQNLNWNGLGFKTIIEILLKQFPNPSQQIPVPISLNKEVVKISWDTSISVECSDNTTYQADHVIFTPSIGVLKAHHAEIFSPPLPVAKQDAIKAIGFGAVMKIPMYFKKAWWPTAEISSFCFIWSEEDKAKVLEEYPEGIVGGSRSWIPELFLLIPVERNPNVLFGWVTGDLVPQVELLDEKRLADGVFFALNKFLGHKFNVTRPDAILSSAWYSNPHFRGTYSFQTVEARKNNESAEVELSKPLVKENGRPAVLFAGEASHPYHYSAVHGAIETGYREADRIMNLYK